MLYAVGGVTPVEPEPCASVEIPPPARFEPGQGTPAVRFESNTMPAQWLFAGPLNIGLGHDGLAALGGGVAGAGLGALVGNRVGGGIASEGYKNAVVPWMIGNAREKTPLTKPVERFKLETEDIPNLRKATPVVQSGLKTLGTAGGAALGAGGGALLGLALYLAFRRTGG
jgi:hypothetical protein